MFREDSVDSEDKAALRSRVRARLRSLSGADRERDSADLRRILLESPEWAVSKGKSADSAVAAMETVLAYSFMNKVWYADYSRYLYNRAAATRAVMPSEGINRFRMEVVDSFRNMNGMQHIYLVEGRK